MELKPSNSGLAMQVPATSHYSMVFYFVAPKAQQHGSLLQRFVNGDDSFRNSRLKLIPSVPKVCYYHINPFISIFSLSSTCGFFGHSGFSKETDAFYIIYCPEALL